MPNGFLKEGNHRAASAVFQGLLQGISNEYETIQDDEGEVGAVAVACCEGLGSCLRHEANAGRRQAILRSLFDYYRRDVDMGGIGLGDEVPGLIVEQATREEKRLVIVWVGEALDETTDLGKDSYARRIFGAFLLDLEGEELGDEAFLKICRETGRKSDLVEKLLELGRADEARVEVESSPDHERVLFADVFLKHGQTELAEVIVRGTLGKGTQDAKALQWLKRRAVVSKDKAATLELSQRLFQIHKSLENYKELRTSASKAQWPELRAQALAGLDPKHDSHTMVRIALDEGEIDQALELVKAARPGFFGPLKLEVAGAAESKRPDAALQIYKEQAERLIDQQGRGNYQSACTLLERVRAVHRKRKDEAGWKTYRDELLTRYRRLSAFQEEITRAKL